jgi:formamidopyrimidine-DNA glycosylase
MPELPEVETVRRGLEQALKGAIIKKVTLRRRDLRIPFPADIAKKLEGRRIKSIRRRAKYLLFDFDSDDVLIAHLGMTGRFSVETKAPKRFSKHDHVVFELSDGRIALYNDARRFGLMTLCKASKIAEHELFVHLGPEPLEDSFSVKYLTSALAKRKAPIKTVLMDQEVVVGVGNIYASEALFLSGVDPRKPAAKAAGKAKQMVDSIHKVLGDALASGGSSLKDFLHVSGESGYFQHQFNVYGRNGKPCVSCSKPVEMIRQAGRSTFYCKHCQN